ncbi:hypothetical protein FRC09_020175 [Ceratobasidium sp. 395]|nr:hypothetical protein FRC09_020175 [Ceratobasidium sp. 395]
MFEVVHRLVVFSFLLLSFIRPSLSFQTKFVKDSFSYNSGQLDGVQYSPEWRETFKSILTPSGNNSTLHVADTPGSKLAYFFRGESIYYFTDLAYHNATVRITLDDQLWEIRTPSSGNELQPLVWSRTGLGPGDHQLTIKHVGIAGESIALDSLRIDYAEESAPKTSGPGAPNVLGTTLIVDKSDPRLIYSGNWTNEAYGTFYEGDAAQAQDMGSSVSFQFNGTAVWYYADTFQDFSGGTRISIDGGPAEMVNTYSDDRLTKAAPAFSLV